MSDLNGVNPTQILKRREVPPIVTQVLLSEYLILAAFFSQHQGKDAGRLVMKRIQEVARGASLNLFTPNEFKEKMALVLKDLERTT